MHLPDYLHVHAPTLEQFAIASTGCSSTWVRPNNESTRLLPNLPNRILAAKIGRANLRGYHIFQRRANVEAYPRAAVGLATNERRFVVVNDLPMQLLHDPLKARGRRVDLFRWQSDHHAAPRPAVQAEAG